MGLRNKIALAKAKRKCRPSPPPLAPPATLVPEAKRSGRAGVTVSPATGTVDLIAVYDRATDRVRLTVASGETTAAELLRILQMLRDEVVAQTAVALYQQQYQKQYERQNTAASGAGSSETQAA